MIRAKKNTHRMGDDQPHKADDSRGIYRETNHQRGNQQVNNPPPVQICAQGYGGFVPQQHQIQCAVLGPKEKRARNGNQQHQNIGLPFCRRQAAQRPADHSLQRTGAGVDDIEYKVGNRSANGRQRRTGENQLDRVGSSAHICQGNHCQRYQECPRKGDQTHISAA